MKIPGIITQLTGFRLTTLPFHGFHESSRPALFFNDGSHSRQKARVPHEHGGEKKHAVPFWWAWSHIRCRSFGWSETTLMTCCLINHAGSYHCLLLEFGMLLNQHLIKRQLFFDGFQTPPFCISWGTLVCANLRSHLLGGIWDGVSTLRCNENVMHTRTLCNHGEHILQLFVTCKYHLHCPWFQAVCCFKGVSPSMLHHLKFD